MNIKSETNESDKISQYQDNFQQEQKNDQLKAEILKKLEELMFVRKKLEAQSEKSIQIFLKKHEDTSSADFDLIQTREIEKSMLQSNLIPISLISVL